MEEMDEEDIAWELGSVYTIRTDPHKRSPHTNALLLRRHYKHTHRQHNKVCSSIELGGNYKRAIA